MSASDSSGSSSSQSSASAGFGALNERRATSFVYDAGQDLARVVVAPARARGTKRSAAATLLLDAAGALVGIDVEPDSARRVVVMLGAHEAVAETREATVDVVEEDGEPCEVHVRNAAAACRATTKNPYV